MEEQTHNEFSNAFASLTPDIVGSILAKFNARYLGNFGKDVPGINYEVIIGLYNQKMITTYRRLIIELADIANSEPSRFYYALELATLEISEKVKSQVIAELNITTYKLSKHLDEVRKAAIRDIGKSYQREITLWGLLDNGYFVEALQVIRVMEKAQPLREAFYMFERDNWKLVIACQTNDLDLFFEAINSMFKHNAEILPFFAQEIAVMVNVMLNTVVSDIEVTLSTLGEDEVQQREEPDRFFAEQIMKFRNFLIGKLLNEILVTKGIDDATDFKLYLQCKRKPLADEYIDKNYFVTGANYKT